ncbi:MAG: sigma-70 family RNA polymerase sigma factor [Planctomycetes bacterium]|nr:sigma-70 family RNA polymerase sigma factor [Planctomycetota bacterium]MCB9872188.1 sigma-70 family RNA polymerase sigma factor [Planctomycetota bacterium]
MSGERRVDGSQTLDLLGRWRAGDAAALGALLDRDMEWIRGFVRRQLGDHLRRVGDTDDFVQEAAVAVLRYGPRFVLDSRAHFRGLVGKIVVNLLRGSNRELQALKRSPDREMPLGQSSVLRLDPPHAEVTGPEERACEAEEREWLRLAQLLLDPADQEVLDLYWQDVSDAEAGERLGVAANTARMRRSRAIARLTATVLKLKRGRLAELVPDEHAAGDG